VVNNDGGMSFTHRKLSLIISYHQNAGQNHSVQIAKVLFENMAQFKYWRTTVTNQNLPQEEIKRRLDSGNAWYHLGLFQYRCCRVDHAFLTYLILQRQLSHLNGRQSVRLGNKPLETHDQYSFPAEHLLL
jgi:hypothetical protein